MAIASGIGESQEPAVRETDSRGALHLGKKHLDPVAQPDDRRRVRFNGSSLDRGAVRIAGEGIEIVRPAEHRRREIARAQRRSVDNGFVIAC
jgi:hypothetical protein